MKIVNLHCYFPEPSPSRRPHMLGEEEQRNLQSSYHSERPLYLQWHPETFL